MVPTALDKQSEHDSSSLKSHEQGLQENLLMRPWVISNGEMRVKKEGNAADRSLYRSGIGLVLLDPCGTPHVITLLNAHWLKLWNCCCHKSTHIPKAYSLLSLNYMNFVNQFSLNPHLCSCRISLLQMLYHSIVNQLIQRLWETLMDGWDRMMGNYWKTFWTLFAKIKKWIKCHAGFSIILLTSGLSMQLVPILEKT